VDPEIADVAADEFLRTYRAGMARVAFFKAARNIYLEKPNGTDGFWTRLARLQRPALFIWGSEDRLVPARFSRHVEAILPEAPQVVLAECGHVPQIELPERTHELIEAFIDSAGAAAADLPLAAAGSA
jgi:pimeloyl-ACP methyl ester carboxylesterase